MCKKVKEWLICVVLFYFVINLYLFCITNNKLYQQEMKSLQVFQETFLNTY